MVLGKCLLGARKQRLKESLPALSGAIGGRFGFPSRACRRCKSRPARRGLHRTATTPEKPREACVASPPVEGPWFTLESRESDSDFRRGAETDAGTRWGLGWRSRVARTRGTGEFSRFDAKPELGAVVSSAAEQKERKERGER